MISPAEDRAAWYCLRSQLKHEAIAAVHLRKLSNVEVFCPRLRFQRPRRGTGWMWATEAMFPSYLFARFDLEQRFREIQYAHGISSIVRFGDRYVPVPDAAIAQLRAEMGQEELATIATPPQPGQEVILTGGALNGLRALVTSYVPAKQRVRVLLEFLGRQLETEVSTEGAIAPFVHPLHEETALRPGQPRGKTNGS